MPEEKMVPDLFSDMFEITGGPYGAVLNFKKSPPEPRITTMPETEARIRMSWEHLKIMTFIVWRQIKRVEGDTGVSYPIAPKVLSDLGVAREDWDSFWTH